jgi:ribonuclease Y
MLEQLLEVTLTVEQNPTSLIISSHNPKNRYLASLTIESLLQTEKITPVTVRDTLEKVSQQMEKEMIEEGERACKKISLTPFPEKLCSLLGSLLFRSSIGQNTLKHSIEVAELMGIVASEMNLDVNLAKKIGLLHDIGKALSPEWGINHALAGKKFLEQFDLNPTIINGVASHHQDESAQSLEARLLPICDRISAQPLGVRNPSEPPFLSIVRACERAAKSVPDISSAWAHYAGSHVELLVRTDCKDPSLHENLRIALSSLQTKLPITITSLPL